MPKVHIENTNLPTHLDEMLKLLIEEDRRTNEITTTTHANVDQKTIAIATTTAAATIPNSNNVPENLSSMSKRECFDFVLTNRPLDLLTDICLTDSPVI